MTLCLALSLVLIASPASDSTELPPDVSDPVSMGPDGPQTSQPSKLEPDILVTAQRHSASATETAVGVNLVDEREIAERQSRTTAETLRFQPGIWVQKTGHNGGAPIIRGFMGNRVVYMFDGIRRNTAGLFAGPNSFLNNIDELDVRRVEVVRGPGSVLYGTDAIGGVVNVLSDEEPRYTDEVGVYGRALGRYASADQERSGRLELGITSARFHGFVGGSLRDIDALTGGRGLGTLEPSGWREENWDTQFSFLLADGHELAFSYQDFNLIGATRYVRPGSDSDANRDLATLTYNGTDLGPVEMMKVTGYFHDQESFTDSASSDSESDEETVGFEIQAESHPFPELRLVYGFHFHLDQLESGDPQRGTLDPDVDWDNEAVFLLSEWQALSRLRFDLGLRWDRFRLRSRAPSFGQLATSIQNAINAGALTRADLNLDETDQALTGSAGLVVDITEEVSLVGHIGRGFRAPNKADM
ncbi:MAG: TonB-dependent receptor, partial [Planctomycetes bacterium]|nr:TonB-dependent receptor [Planctomycetota bacterium]